MSVRSLMSLLPTPLADDDESELQQGLSAAQAEFDAKRPAVASSASDLIALEDELEGEQSELRKEINERRRARIAAEGAQRVMDQRWTAATVIDAMPPSEGSDDLVDGFAARELSEHVVSQLHAADAESDSQKVLETARGMGIETKPGNSQPLQGRAVCVAPEGAEYCLSLQELGSAQKALRLCSSSSTSLTVS
jgi:hypothetical protein